MHKPLDRAALEIGIIALDFRMPCTESPKRPHYENEVFGHDDFSLGYDAGIDCHIELLLPQK